MLHKKDGLRMEQWFYESSGARQGPVTAAELSELFKNDTIFEGSLVWTNAFGGNWKTFLDVFPQQREGRPPPLPKSRINNVYVWLIAILPILGSVIEKISMDSGIIDTTNSLSILTTWSVVSCGLMFLDTKQITNSGQNTLHISIGVWFWFTPAYLFQRARALEQKRFLLYIWLASFLVSLIILAPGTESDPVYFGQGLPACDDPSEQMQVKSLFNQLPSSQENSIISAKISNITALNQSEEINGCSAVILGNDQNDYDINYTITKQETGYYTRVVIAP
jgi:hypothetical protein